MASHPLYTRTIDLEAKAEEAEHAAGRARHALRLAKVAAEKARIAAEDAQSALRLAQKAWEAHKATPGAQSKPFVVTCLWLDMDGVLMFGASGADVLARVAELHNLEGLYGESFSPAEGADYVDSWSVHFKGQEWSNGDWNPESLSVYEAEEEDIALPC
jgi:hypothetical protein